MLISIAAELANPYKVKRNQSAIHHFLELAENGSEAQSHAKRL